MLLQPRDGEDGLGHVLVTFFFFWTKVGQVILKASTAVASGSRCHETAELSDLALRLDAIKSRLHERRSGLP